MESTVDDEAPAV
ncbi:uncharacterized LOC128462377 isoform 1 [Homo sapiens]|uniref:Uncharacterized protein n=1 Tax=Homo sapiens TaxID=9606 RepID=A0AAA9YHJ5_HUMAN|nr:uncharacterized LOC128462377 isoform 1 [Homo sapiens]